MTKQRIKIETLDRDAPLHYETVQVGQYIVRASTVPTKVIEIEVESHDVTSPALKIERR